MNRKTYIWERDRRVDSGYFVTAAYAAKHPNLCEHERRRMPLNALKEKRKAASR